jgi:hypothetical protein
MSLFCIFDPSRLEHLKMNIIMIYIPYYHLLKYCLVSSGLLLYLKICSNIFYKLTLQLQLHDSKSIYFPQLLYLEAFYSGMAANRLELAHEQRIDKHEPFQPIRILGTF